MILSWVLIGVTVGLLLGLTGAGGAVIAIPLFVHMVGVSLREATVLSLAAVASGAVLNWLIQRRNADYRTGFLLFLFSVLGTFAFRPLKAFSPDWMILTLFIAVTGLSLFGVWRKTGPMPTRLESPSDRLALVKSASGGFVLGALVTMTGLGGGVVLVPMLTGFFGLSLTRAAATSLFAITLTSVTSLLLQWHLVSTGVALTQLMILSVGSILSAFLIRVLLQRVSMHRLDLARKWIITLVILVSIASLLSDAFLPS